jgi:hypothetical protein
MGTSFEHACSQRYATVFESGGCDVRRPPGGGTATTQLVLIGLAFVFCIATVPLAGGRLGALADVRLRAGWLLLAALAIQIAIISIFPGWRADGQNVAHLASYVLLAGFLLANRRLPYVWLIALGGALNFVAIAANGGVMPADPEALARAGLSPGTDGFSNSAALEDPRLLFLGDVLAIPESWPVTNVFSVGDVVIILGAFMALHAVSGSRLGIQRFSRISWRTGAQHGKPR